MNKIRIINSVLDRVFKETDPKALLSINNCLNQSLNSDSQPIKRYNWLHILSAMQEIETIFAIPPIILTPYVNNNALYPEHLYALVNPLSTIINHNQLNQYITELETLIQWDVPDHTMNHHENRLKLIEKINKYQ